MSGNFQFIKFPKTKKIITGYLSNIYNIFTYKLYHNSKQGDTLQIEIEQGERQ